MKTWKTKSGYKVIRLLSGRSNVFLLTDGKRNLLIDTSVARSWHKLKYRIERTTSGKINYLILTHAHFDHAANAKRLQEECNPIVIIQTSEAAYLSGGDNILPGGTNFITRLIVNLIGKRIFNRFRYAPCTPDILVDDKYDLNYMGFRAYLLHTPGHTSGSMSLIIDNEIAIVGDTMFGVFKWSVFPPYAEDQEMMLESWGKLLETGCSLFFPSHGTANSRALLLKDYNKRIRKIQACSTSS